MIEEEVKKYIDEKLSYIDNEIRYLIKIDDRLAVNRKHLSDLTDIIGELRKEIISCHKRYDGVIEVIDLKSRELTELYAKNHVESQIIELLKKTEIIKLLKKTVEKYTNEAQSILAVNKALLNDRMDNIEQMLLNFMHAFEHEGLFIRKI
jgi:hypothetical protein